MTVHRYTAFTTNPAGGNPAGVVVADGLPSADKMLAVAAEVGYSETVFAEPVAEREFRVRYFSPTIEVPFCGHATIALGVHLADTFGPGDFLIHTAAGDVPLTTRKTDDGLATTLTSVPPRSEPADPTLVDRTLDLLGWHRTELASWTAPSIVHAGADHLLLPVATRECLADMTYDFAPMAELMNEHGLITTALVWREDRWTLHARNIFAPGGVVEDPATGAAAAAIGGHLREHELADVPSEVLILQGVDMHRPSLLTVRIPREGGIEVTGNAVRLD